MRYDKPFLTGSAGLAFPGRLVNHRPAANNDFFFTKVFGDGEYIAAGQLLIPPKMNKPSKMTKDNTYVRLLLSFRVTWLMSTFRQDRCSM